MQDSQAIQTIARALTDAIEANARDGKLAFPIGKSLVKDDIAIEIKTNTRGDLVISVFVTYEETIRRVSVVPFDRSTLISTIQDMIAPLRLAQLANEAINVYQNRIAAMTSVMTHIIGE